MTRMKISAGILAALTIICIGFGIYIRLRCNKLIGMIDETYTYAIAGDTENVSGSAAEFAEKWSDFHNFAHIIVRSDKLSEIEAKAARIAPLAESDCDELTAEISELKKLVIQLRDGEIPSLGRIF
ncbi:MAG: DUF4363 family protein [Ruminococcus sp.]